MLSSLNALSSEHQTKHAKTDLIIILILPNALVPIHLTAKSHLVANKSKLSDRIGKPTGETTV